MKSTDERLSAIEANEISADKAIHVFRENAAEQIHQGDTALKTHIDQQFTQLATALDSSNRAQDKFEESVVERFKQVNEFRGALDDLGKSMATRRELEAAVVAMKDERSALLEGLNRTIERNSNDLTLVRKTLDERAGEAGSDVTDRARKAIQVAMFTGALGVVAIIVTVILALVA